jgi:DNA-binding transcriptional LysR family regulator
MVVTEEFNDIPAFVAVVEAGSFSDAARRLNLSRSAVGKAVSRLEERVGGRLFYRTTRTLSLTEDGLSFYEYCQRALVELRAGQDLMDSGRTEIRGRLRVSMPVLFGRRCVAPILLRLSAAHPKLELDMHFSDRLVDLVDDGFDLCVRNGRPDDPRDCGRTHAGVRVTSLS